MSRLLLYNPDNDLALASGLERYTPPAAGRLMAEAGALLPLWWAEPDDCILADRQLEADAGRLCRKFGLHGSLDLSDSVTEASPWGWSLASRRRFLDAGMSEAQLPSTAEIDRLRQLSHRRSTIALLRAIGYPACQLPAEADTVSQALNRIATCGGRAVVKQPWSCSGRGVAFTESIQPQALQRMLEGWIRRQGSVIIEPVYDRVAEMAALYYADGRGSVMLRGMSAFSSDDRGNYQGNIVAPQEYICQRCGPDAIEAAHGLAAPLAALIGGSYRGWLGIDMLRHREGLLPCMELNLRMTMGVVAMLIAERLPAGTHPLELRTVTATRPDDLILSPASSTLAIVLRKI